MEEEQQEQRRLATCTTAAQVKPLCSIPTDEEVLQMQQHLLIEASGCTDDDNKLALVPHPGTKDMIVYFQPEELVRKKKSRPKVVLDEATLRCWNLLMGPEAIDDEDVESLKLEEERKAMKQRVVWFLNRTREVQG